MRSVEPALGVILSAFLLPGELCAQRQGTAEIEIEREYPRLPSISQGSTGTCWSFATTSFLESEIERLHGKSIDLFEIFPVYYGYLEKAERFVRLHGKSQFGQGGLCHDVMYIAKQHGLAPASAYSGLRAGDKAHNHSELAKLLGVMLEELATGKQSDKWRDALRGVLNVYLGEPPKSFAIGGKQMTPLEFAHGELALPYDDYVTMMSFESQGFGHEAELLVPDNWLRYQKYKNVPVDTMMDALDHALRSGFTCAVDMDVSERGFKMGDGVARLPKGLEEPGAITDEMRQRLFDERKTTDDHLMHVVGIAKDKKGGIYYLTKNSWGPTGPNKGHLFMSRNFTALKMLSFMTHADAFPE